MPALAHITPDWTTGETGSTFSAGLRARQREAGRGRLMWIYVLGERNGEDIKIGKTKEPTVEARIAGVDRDQMSDASYVLLAACLGPSFAEAQIKKGFEPYRRTDKGSRTEYFWPEDELVDWVLWLREQFWTSFEPQVRQDEWQEVECAHWLPGVGRKGVRPAPDPDKMVQDYEQFIGPLAGTAWSWMPDPTASFQDYFTPPEYVAPAIPAMGSIDIDIASHWLANRKLHLAGVEIGAYFHVNRSAFDHDWVGNGWLNPPYGENERWFRRAEEMMFEKGSLEQLCMLSPVWAFTTATAAEMVKRAAAGLLLSPTPKFHNPAEPLKTGTNLPHALVYWGSRPSAFLESYRWAGIPFRFAWDEMARADIVEEVAA